MANLDMNLFNTVGLNKYTQEETEFLSEVVNNIGAAKNIDLWTDDDFDAKKRLNEPLHFELCWIVGKDGYGITAEMFPDNGGYEYGVLYCKNKKENICLHLLNWNCWESKKYQRIIEKKDMKAIAQWLFLSLKALGEVRANNIQACLTLFNN